jgi:hypothetical protein
MPVGYSDESISYSGINFLLEYTSAVNNKIASDGCVIPIKSWRTTSRFSTGASEKIIINNKLKSLTRIMVVPRQNRCISAMGLGADQYCSRISVNSATNGCAYVATDSELESYRFLIGSSPVTDHSIVCTKGGAAQFAEMQKFFRSLGSDINLPLGPSSAVGKKWVDLFKIHYGLICQNFNLENIESDDVFTGQFANSFSDITLETRWTKVLDGSMATLDDAEKLELMIYMQYNALLTVTPTALLIES